LTEGSKSLDENEYPDEPIEITDENLDETVQNYPFIAIDCWSTWCIPCLAIMPIIKKLAKTYKGKVVFGELNIAKNKEATTRFDLKAIPVLLVFKNGQLVDRLTGAYGRKTIESRLELSE
jgi:thioredoxin 1